MMAMSERSLMVPERGAPGPTDPSRKIMRLTAISRAALSRRTYRGRLVLVIAVSVSALAGGTLAAVAATGHAAAAARDPGANAGAAQGSEPYIFVHDPTMAPDISYFGGLWHLYYAGSSFGSNNSVIGLATTPTLDPRSPRYHWTDQGLVFRTTTADNFNAIDPSLATAADGGKWLALGSFWSGIKMIKLDAATGKPAASPTVYSLAAKPFPDPEEGAGIVYHGGYYYLFASVDNCCRGISSTYHIQVGRSTSITGPYVDAAGTDMMNGGGMEVQGTDAGMIGAGGEFAFGNGDAWVQVRPLTWADGWPVTGQALVPVPGQAGPPAS